MRVLSADELFRCIEADDVLKKIFRGTRLAQEVFDRDLLPALRNYAEFVQLLPASEAYHHANPGGLLAHGLETVLHALTFRTGHLLPRGAAAEAISAERDFWTYAVLISALLHDVGKPIADLRVLMRRSNNKTAVEWAAIGGSLNSCDAVEYYVGFKKKGERNYGAHSRFGTTLLQRLVPGTTLSFMARAPSVLDELNRYLSGEGGDGALGEIIKKADQESTRRNLASGSRARFETARNIPLIEKLMSAMKAMLSQGGHLPLNRDGSAGWVYDGSVWFVAKRLADSVREYIVKHADEEDDGIPGETKNDRLFDAWQEYGYSLTNPETNQAIWRVVVTGMTKDGAEAYRHDLSMLRFPLAKLWSDPDEYPDAMLGTLEIASKGLKPAQEPSLTDEDPSGTPQPLSLPETEPTQTDVIRPATKEDAAPEVKKVPAPKFAAGGSTTKKAKHVADPDDLLDELDSAKAEAKAARREMMAQRSGTIQPPPAPTPTPGAVSSHDPVDSSTSNHRGEATAVDGPSAANRIIAGATSAIPLPQQKLPRLDATKVKEPSALAIRFMEWVQAGLFEGKLKHNEGGALVHFIDFGMALVSPLIFKQFAAACDDLDLKNGPADEFAMTVQRELIRAEWHIPAAGGKNVWTLYVTRKPGQEPSKLSAVVLKDPHIWVAPVPPPNPYISATKPVVAEKNRDAVPAPAPPIP